MTKDDYTPVELLHVVVQRTREKASAANASDGLRDNLTLIWRKLRKIRSFKDNDGAKRIGVFGPPNRGKSTLLNELLGTPILPTSPIPMSKTVVEAQQATCRSIWHITVTHEDGFLETFERQDIGHAQEIIEEYGSHRGKALAATRIEVRSAFEASPILAHGGVLIDTPGAEIAFESEESDTGEDTRRALRILDDVHVVLFCVRADQIDSETESLFYEKYMKPLEPLTIINFKDKAEDSEALMRDAFKKYKFNRERTVLVSARQAQKASNEEERQVSGIPELEKAVLREVEELNPRKGVLVCVRNFAEVLGRQEKSGDLLPERIHLTRFFDFFKDKSDETSRQIASVQEGLNHLYER